MVKNNSVAPATPSSNLPKSNYHHTIASASPRISGPAASASNPSVPDLDLKALADQSPVNPHFTHPERPIPGHNFDGIENLIIVCCHAIFHPDPSLPNFPLHSPYDERNWHLAPFQKSSAASGKPGEHETFLSHLTAGLDALTTGSWASKSVLILSGGVTKKNLTPISEARSYYNAAVAQALVQGHENRDSVRQLFDRRRILLEEQATDSFQNLLFSMILFRRTTGYYPDRVRVITHAFKTKRFLELHAPAIRWPKSRIQVQGIDPVMSTDEYAETLKGEVAHGYTPWIQDPLGVGQALGRKRKQRGWDERSIGDLVLGLEQGVMQLVKGEEADILPWELPQSDKKVDKRVDSHWG